MTSLSFFIVFIPILAVLLLGINIIFAPHNPYQEKDSMFECGFHSFSGQNRNEVAIPFVVFGLLFMVFDIEIALVLPYIVSINTNGALGLTIVLVFFIFLTLGFVYELGKGALTINSKQNITSKETVSSRRSKHT